ncbi:collagen-binding domain-containing protein [Anaerosacchariphilus polymeriproducens]|nr:collagen-binding domain-containing protein [Anaerosacchariphilus polymeriproducens]
MLKREGKRLRRLTAIMMTIIMTFSQLQISTYAKDKTQQLNVQHEKKSGTEIIQTEDENAEEQKEVKGYTPDEVQKNDKDKKINLELYENLKKAVTISEEGYEKGLGTASNFGIFINGFFHAKSDFEANFAVRNLYSLKSPKASVEKEQSKKVSYIQNFSDKYGNELKNHPLPNDYAIVAPYLVIGSQYHIDDTFHNGHAYGIDGVRLGGKEELEVLQDPEDTKLIDFDSEFSYLNKLSVHLAQLDTTDTAKVKTDGNYLELESTSEDIDIFNLSSTVFTKGKNKKIKLNMLHQSATCIINVNIKDSYRYDWNTQAEIVGENAEIARKAGRIIWNFYKTDVDNGGKVIYKPYKGKLSTMATMGGTFLAPSASVEIGDGNFYGSIIANNLITNDSKITKISFSGKIPFNGQKKGNDTSDVTIINSDSTATYTGDFNSEKCNGSRTYQLNLSATSNMNTNDKQVPNEIVLVLKRPNTVKEGKEIVEAAKQFVANVKENSPESSIDVISYSANNNGLAFYDRTNGWVNVEESYEKIIAAIEGLTKEETLQKSDLGIHIVFECFEQSEIIYDTKEKSVILFYDGVPNIYDEIEDKIEMSAFRMEAELGVEIFTVGNLIGLYGNRKSEAETFLKKVATKDSFDQRLFYQTTENQSLKDIFNKISYQIAGKTKEITIRNYISEYFQLTKKCKAELEKMKDVSYQYDEKTKCWFVEWKNQAIYKNENWTATLELKAKGKFIGGNNICVDHKDSGIYWDNILISRFPQTKVNVPVKFRVKNLEGTIGQGEMISEELYDEALKKNVPVEELILDVADKNDLFLGKEPTGEFDYEWYLDNIRNNRVSNLAKQSLNKDTKILFKVTFKPYHTDTETDGKKGLATSTNHTGSYNIYVKNVEPKNLWVNNEAVHYGFYSAVRDYWVHLAATMKQTKQYPKDIVLILENDDTKYASTIATNYVVGQTYIYHNQVTFSSESVTIQKDTISGKLYFVSMYGGKKYIDSNTVLFNLPESDDALVVEEKKAAVQFIQNLKEISPESNLCILTNSESIEDRSVVNVTNGFKNITKYSEDIIKAINALPKGTGDYKRELTLEETYNLFNQEAIKTNGKDKMVILCSEKVNRDDNFDEAIKYADLLKNDLHANIHTISISSFNEEYGIPTNLPNTLASENKEDPARKYNYVTNDVFKIGNVLESILNNTFGTISGAEAIIYLDHHFEFTEQTKERFDNDPNIICNYDPEIGYYVKFKNITVPTKEDIWTESFEVIYREPGGGSNIPIIKKESGIYLFNKKIKEFPELNVNVTTI